MGAGLPQTLAALAAEFSVAQIFVLALGAEHGGMTLSVVPSPLAENRNPPVFPGLVGAAWVGLANCEK
jgi:hypothetical protein